MSVVRTFLALVAASAVLCGRGVCTAADGIATDENATQESLDVLANSAATGIQVSNALRQPAPEVLTRISTDSHFPEENRRRCVFQLLRPLGHYPRRPLSEIAALLGHVPWLEERDVAEIAALTGSINVDDDPKGTVIMIPIFPRSQRKDSAILFQFRGQIPTDVFYKIISGRVSGSLPDPVVNEIGLLEEGVPDPNPEALERWLRAHPQIRRSTR